MPHDRLGRRSRFKRTPTGKNIVLTDRDAEMLCLLFRYRFLRATQLVAFLQPKSEKRFIERLGDLYHESGLIDRPAAQWRRFDARYVPLIYELSPKGLRYLESTGHLPHRAVTFATKSRTGATPQFDHAMMIVDVLVAAELETRRTGQRFVPVDEILARAPKKARKAKQPLAIPVTIPPNLEVAGVKTAISTRVIPDGLYGIEYLIDGEKRYRFHALECENTSPKRRSTAKLSSLSLKQAAYREIARTQAHRCLGIPNLTLQIAARHQAP